MSYSFATSWTSSTRFLCPWGSPGKNAGAGCHFLLVCRVTTNTELSRTEPSPWDSPESGSSDHVAEIAAHQYMTLFCVPYCSKTPHLVHIVLLVQEPWTQGCCCQVVSVMSDSVWPHRWQPTRLRCPWNSPGKNTGLGCHFLLQCMKVESEKSKSPTFIPDSEWPHGLQPTRLFHPWDFPDKNTGVGCMAFSVTYKGEKWSSLLKEAYH